MIVLCAILFAFFAGAIFGLVLAAIKIGDALRSCVGDGTLSADQARRIVDELGTRAKGVRL